MDPRIIAVDSGTVRSSSPKIVTHCLSLYSSGECRNVTPDDGAMPACSCSSLLHLFLPFHCTLALSVRVFAPSSSSLCTVRPTPLLPCVYSGAAGQPPPPSSSNRRLIVKHSNTAEDILPTTTRFPIYQSKDHRLARSSGRIRQLTNIA